MVKATLRGGVLLGLVSVGMFITSMPSYAEVQNVRISGDVTARAFIRENLDLNDEGGLDASSSIGGPLEGDRFFMTTTGINIGADLTENVSAFIRLANERDWNQDATAAAGDVELSQSYITLKELFYSPLTLRIGTQPIVWGRGFILGSTLLPTTVAGPGAALPGTGIGDDRNAAITANEFTDFTSFDAIRATLDLSGLATDSPLTADIVYIKLDENGPGVTDDVNIIGVNLSTRFDDMNGELEVYYLNKRDKNFSPTTLVGTVGSGSDGSMNTLGIRGSAEPVEGSSIYGELAFQTGKANNPIDGDLLLVTGGGQQGWAFDIGMDYTFADVASAPTIGGEWIYYSGKNEGGAATTGWQPVAPSYFPTMLRSFQTRAAATGLYPNDQTGVTSGYTNQHELALYGSFTPIEDLNVAPRLSLFLASEEVTPVSAGATAGTPKRDRYLGTEFDTSLTYDYTDDVQFGLAYGVFFPGTVFVHAGIGASGDTSAHQFVSTVSLKF